MKDTSLCNTHFNTALVSCMDVAENLRFMQKEELQHLELHPAGLSALKRPSSQLLFVSIHVKNK